MVIVEQKVIEFTFLFLMKIYKRERKLFKLPLTLFFHTLFNYLHKDLAVNYMTEQKLKHLIIHQITIITKIPYTLHLLYARHCSRYFMDINLCNFHKQTEKVKTLTDCQTDAQEKCGIAIQAMVSRF
jgi:hypothetical protein